MSLSLNNNNRISIVVLKSGEKINGAALVESEYITIR